MKALFNDVGKASPAAKRDARRELAITVGIALSAFFVGPLVFSLLTLPLAGAGEGMLATFAGSDVYIASVSLLSISIYSISKEYNVEGRDYFGFPHAVTILLSALLIVVVAFSVCTAHAVYEAVKPYLLWRSVWAGILGWVTFILATLLAYAVLVLRNDMEKGGAIRVHADEEAFVRAFQAQPGGTP
ncbi:MAG TPA: hypothetical protein VHW60_18660 [Caulobacteraceae bacterium]|jgi:hypothetical protein|nr:hypothetical protein [Caulobacteraceae bacterium]